MSKYKNFKKQYNTTKQKKMAHPIFDSICMMHFIRMANLLYKHKKEHLTAMHLMIIYVWWLDGRTSHQYKDKGDLPYVTGDYLVYLIKEILNIEVTEKDIDNHMHYLCKYKLFHSKDNHPIEMGNKSYYWGPSVGDQEIAEIMEHLSKSELSTPLVHVQKQKLTLKNFNKR